MKYILKKELTRVFSDKKLVFSIFILPAFIMILIYSIMGNAMKTMIQDIEQRASLVHIVNSPDNFKSLIESGDLGFESTLSFSEADMSDEESISDYKDKIFKGELDLIICFPKDFEEKINNYAEGDSIDDVPEVKTYYNSTKDYSGEARQRFGNVLEQYRQMLLTERVGDINRLTVFTVDRDPESSMLEEEGAGNAKMLSMILPYLIVLLLFTGPMSLGIDSITGEKERGTMASMLVTPVKRRDIVTGKMVAVSILSLISSLIYAGSLIFAVPMMNQDIGESLNISVNFDMIQIVGIILIILALVYLYVNLVSFIAVLAKNAKEAQSFVMPVYILVMVAGVFTIFGGNTEPEFFRFAIPVYGSAIGIQQLIVGNLKLSELFLNLGITLCLSAVISFAISRGFDNEKIMFNA